MNKMLKKMLSAVLAAAILLSLSTCVVLADTEQTQADTQSTENAEEPEENDALSEQSQVKKEGESDSNVNITEPLADGVSISSPDDPELVSLVPDANFRKAIYDAFEEYGWLAGNPDDPPETVQEILETYQGPIEAEKSYSTPDSEKIKSIEGIQYLKIATTADQYYEIDLYNNLIEDLTPLINACKEDPFHYGGYVYCTDVGTWKYRPVVIELKNNPIRCFPNDFVGEYFGYLIIKDLTGSDVTYVDPADLQFYYKREDTERYDGFLRVGFVQYGSMEPDAEYVTIDRIEITMEGAGNADLSEDAKIIVEKTADGPNKNENIDARFTNLTRSCSPFIGAVMEYCLWSWSINAETGMEAPDVTSMAPMLFPTFTIFDNVQISNGSTGSLQLRKIDEQTGEALNGAVFSLYKQNDTGEDELIRENLETATREVEVYDEATQEYKTESLPGYTERLDNLEPGTYYFVETKAPENYELNTEKITATVGAAEPYLSGGEKSLDYESADGSIVQAESQENETYVTWQMRDAVEICLSNLTEDFSDDEAEDIVESVEINYHSLDGSLQPVVEEYGSIAEAENALNTYVRDNKITGAVEISLTYNRNSQFLYQCVTAENTKTEEQFFDLHLLKEDRSSGDDLSGAEFMLYQGEMNQNPVQDEPYTTNSEGEITVSDLKEGTYYLVETKAPNGYQLLANPVKIDVSWDGDTMAVSVDNKDITSEDPKDQIYIVRAAESNDQIHMKIYNSKNFSLPLTGSEGGFLIMGGTLTVLATLLFILWKMGKRPRAEE